MTPSKIAPTEICTEDLKRSQRLPENFEIHYLIPKNFVSFGTFCSISYLRVLLS